MQLLAAKSSEELIIIMNIQCPSLKVILTVLLLAALVTGQCPTNNEPALLQTGEHIFSNGFSFSPLNRQKFYQFPISYTVPASGVQVTASAAAFRVNSQFGIDFFIRAGPGSNPQTAVIALIINEDNSWNSIRLHYLATSREDFRVGIFSMDSFFLQRNNLNSAFSYTYSLPGWESTTERVTAVTELAGLKTSSASYSARLERVLIDAASGELTVVMRLNSNPLFERISISYIIFKQSAPFTLTPFSTQNPPNSNGFDFVGLQGITNGASADAGVLFTSTFVPQLPCEGANCPQNCLTSQECSANSGTVVNQKCLICGFGQSVVGDACRTNSLQCPTNEVESNGECVCQSFFVRVNGVCYRICAANAAIINSQCQCVPGFTFSNTARACVAVPTVSCPPNFTPVNGQCLCQAPRGLVNNSCVDCPAFSFRANNARCVCNPGFTLNIESLTCQQNCQLNAARNTNGDCQCIQGFVLSNSQCIRAPSCTNGRVWNGAECACPPGQLIDAFNGTCTACNTPDRAMNGTQCICSRTYRPTSTGCQACPANSLYNSTNRQCICISGFYLSGGSCLRTQVCPSRSNWNPQLNICVCQFSDQHVINGFCQPCARYSQWNGSDCVCDAGFYKVEDFCTKDCPQNQTWNGISCLCNRGFNRVGGNCVQCGDDAQYNALTQVCVCKQGFVGNGFNCICPNGRFVIEGNCVTCDVNSIYSDSLQTCLCRDGWHGNFQLCLRCDQSCQTCSGPTNQNCLLCAQNYSRQSDNSCVINCPENASWNGTACTCNANFNLLNGQCVIGCPFNSQWNGNSCECLSGLSLIDDNCVRCHPNSTYVAGLGTCTCNDGWYGDYTLCQQCHSTCLTCSGGTNRDCLTCRENFRLNNNNRCRLQSCPEGFYIQGNNCRACPQNCIECTDATTCTRCNSTFSLAPDNSCVASVSCPGDAFWDGSTCLCANSLFHIDGICQACDSNSVYDPVQKTCNCNDGWWGTFDRCRRCHETCQTCSANGQRNCLSCFEGFELRSNGRCREATTVTPTPVVPVSCGDGQFNDNGACTACLENCKVCTDAVSCDTCDDGFSQSTRVQGLNLIVSCVTPQQGPSSTISLTNSVIGNGVVFQGVTMDVMPIPILVLDCSICDDLLLVETVSQVATITPTSEYVTNSQYWFAVTFNVGTTLFTPSFTFSIRINPLYSQYFSSADMQQKLEGFFGPGDSEVTSRPVLGPVASTNQSPPSLIPAGSTPNTPAQEVPPPELNEETLIALFS